MSTIKNKDTIYAVMRVNNSFTNDNSVVVCCFTKSEEHAQDLANQYEQDFLDKGIDLDEFRFYVVGNVFYDD